MKKFLLTSLLWTGILFISVAQQQLINSGDTWKYLDDGTNQGTAWTAKGFDDAAWKNGISILGYSTDNTDPVLTTVGFGSDANNKYVTTYFRKTINIADVSKIVSLSADIIRDDGIIVYINGTEVLRDNMLSGAVTNTSLAITGLADPAENNWNTFSLSIKNLVQGDNVIAVEIHQSGVTSTDILFDMKLTASEQQLSSQLLVNTGDTWKYLDDGTDQGASWITKSFSDAAWKSGISLFAYGNEGEATTVGYGTDANNKYITTYFRKTITISDITKIKSLTADIVRDDGIVVYMNGTEILRDNLPAGTINYKTVASTTMSDPNENAWNTFTLDASKLVQGDNLIAVEIHQDKVTSSDIIFDMKLTAQGQTPVQTVNFKKGPYLIYPLDNTKMNTLWQVDVTAKSKIEWGLDTNYTVGNDSTTEYGTDHQHNYTITGLIPGKKYFYRISMGSKKYTSSFKSGSPDTDTKLSFFIWGDTRDNAANQSQITTSINKEITSNPNYQTFIIHVGDWVNSDDETIWTNEFFNRSYPENLKLHAYLPMMGVKGNHEGAGVVYQKYFPYNYQPSAAYYSYDYGPVHIAFIDQYVNYYSGSTQMIWLENDLKNSTKKWKFIVLHEPGYSAGGSHPNNATVQALINPLCIKYHASIVFGGHNHYYARCVINNIVHLTVGGGGASPNTPSNTATGLVSATPGLSYMRIDVNEDTLHAYTKKVDGTQVDAFTLYNILNSIEENNKSFIDLRFVPNADYGVYKLFSNVDLKGVTISVYNINGQLVNEVKNTNGGDSMEINLSNQSEGIYVYKILINDKVLNGKLLLVKVK